MTEGEKAIWVGVFLRSDHLNPLDGMGAAHTAIRRLRRAFDRPCHETALEMAEEVLGYKPQNEDEKEG